MWNTQQNTEDKDQQSLLKEQGNIPKHVAIIMDGNGRWAKNQFLPRLNGHREGIESVRDIVKASSQLGVKFLTLYAFSIENWKRPESEISGLMKLLENFLKSEIDELDENSVRIKTIGKTSSLPKSVQQILFDCIERTKENKGLTLTLALSYGARWDITRATQLISMDVRRGKLSPEDVSETTITEYLQTKFMPDPDLLIRTSGEFRLSNYLLWEMAYGEIYISSELWPKFRRNHLYEAISCFQGRERRFGKTSDQIKSNSGDSYFQKISNVFKKS